MSELATCNIKRRKTTVKLSRERAKRAQQEGEGIALPS
jgi:hypothetical protein